MGGHTVPAVLETAAGLPALPLTVIPMYFELDGTFPNHEANPLDPKNLVDLQAAVREHGADLGLAFDGDADRCFVVDERGEPVSPSAITALIARREVARAVADGADAADVAIVHNVICSAQVPEVIAATGARAVRTRVGHSFIKAEMARQDAVFGGEHSAHYYFRDFWFADTGMLAAMHTLAALGEQHAPLSTVMGDLHRYAASGEINSTVTDVAGRHREGPGLGRHRGRRHRRARRTHAHPRRRRGRPDVVAQPAGVQHRAAPATQRRGRRRGHDGARPRHRPRPRPRLTGPSRRSRTLQTRPHPSGVPLTGAVSASGCRAHPAAVRAGCRAFAPPVTRRMPCPRLVGTPPGAAPSLAGNRPDAVPPAWPQLTSHHAFPHPGPPAPAPHRHPTRVGGSAMTTATPGRTP